MRHSPSTPPEDWIQALALPVASAPQDSPEALPDTVQVWRLLPERAPDSLERLLAELDPQERAQAQSKRTAEAARAHAVAHVGLRRILATELGVEPASIALSRTAHPHGKPTLVDAPQDAPPNIVDRGGLHFNLSHTRGLALVALARGVEVGIDVEWLGRRVRAEALAGSLFTPAEREEMARAPEAERDRCFLQLWTRREAYAKMTGEGLSRAVARGSDPDDPSFEAERDIPSSELGDPEAGAPFAGPRATLMDLNLGETHVGALAVEEPG
jgi:4'-phosphopantetheinyl transferase